MEARCKKHPSHRQSKGVCPSCLRERLAHLSAASSSATTTTNGSSSSRTSVYLSDSNNSNGSPGASSPPVGARVSRVKMAALLGARPEEPLTKSRSLAFVITAAGGGEGVKVKKQEGKTGGGGDALVSSKTKGSFWTRLMPGKASRRRLDAGAGAAAKDIGGLHSKTVKETASARWVL